MGQNIRPYSKDEVIELIKFYSKVYNFDETTALKIAYCESGYRWNAKNSHSTASGVYQFIRSTWLATSAGQDGLSPFDARANVEMALYKLSHYGTGAWDSSKSCWKK